MRALFYIVCLLIITGCSLSNSRPGELAEAGALMHTDPAAALSKLNGMDVSEFKDSATLAQWALLYSEAMVQNRLSAPTDTIVNIAIDYYGRHNLKAEYQKATRFKQLIRSSMNSDPLATALYLQKEKEFLLYKERCEREKLTYLCLLLLIIAGGMILWMRQRMKIQALRNDALIAEASGLKNRIIDSRGDIDRLETKLQDLLRNRFILIDSLCQTYYESQGTKIERKAIVDKVKSEIESIRTGSFPELEQSVNDCRNNLLAEVKEIYPDIKEQDYQLLVYISCWLSTRTISLLLDESVDVVYKRKSRLKARMKEFVAPERPDIMEIF